MQLSKEGGEKNICRRPVEWVERIRANVIGVPQLVSATASGPLKNGDLVIRHRMFPSQDLSTTSIGLWYSNSKLQLKELKETQTLSEEDILGKLKENRGEKISSLEEIEASNSSSHSRQYAQPNS